MITIQSSPKEFELALNPILLQLSTDNQFAPAGVAAEVRLTLASNVSDGDSFTLKMNDGTTLTFTFRNSPDNSGLEINTALDIASLVVNIQTAFNSNYYMSSNYTTAVSFDGGSGEGIVTLNAIYSGDGLNVQLISPPTDMTLTVLTTGVTEVERLNFSFVLHVYKRPKSTSKWTVIERRVKPYQGVATVNLSSCLDDEFWKTNLPVLSTFATIKNNGVGEYKVKIAEAWNLPREVQRMTETPIRYFGEGGLSRSDHFVSRFYDRFLDTTPAAGFMTWIDHPVNLFNNEFHVLTYLRKKSSSAEQIKLHCRSTALDGSTSETSIVIGTVSDYDVVTLKVEPSIFGLDVHNLRKMMVWVAETNFPSVPISKEVQFDFKTNKPVDLTCLIYKNGIGYFDTFNLRGNKAPSVSAQKTISSRATETYLDSYDHFEFIESVMGGQSWTINTGFLSKTEMNRLFDLLLSTEVFLAFGQELIPVELDGSSQLELYSSPGSRINNADIIVKHITDNRYGTISTSD